MLKTTLMVAALAAAIAMPAAAQDRGTMEFGAFASGAMFEKSLSLETGYGGGGRIGMYLDRRWSVEFEDAEMRASRPNGLKDVNVGILSGRLVVSDYERGRITVFGGAGLGGSTETNFLHSYGANLMVGFKTRLTTNSALRLDSVVDFLANQEWATYQSLRLGITWYRHAARAPAPGSSSREQNVIAK